MVQETSLVSPCGIYCADCPAYKAKDDPVMMRKMLTYGFSKKSLPCPGCRPLKGKCPVIGGSCETYDCFEKKNITFCYECKEFPCSRFEPTADKAAAAMQNTKCFNLCYIQKHGLDTWLANTVEIKKRYFQGKLVYGKGPVL